MYASRFHIGIVYTDFVNLQDISQLICKDPIFIDYQYQIPLNIDNNYAD
jgi:hypothetical protein